MNDAFDCETQRHDIEGKLKKKWLIVVCCVTLCCWFTASSHHFDPLVVFLFTGLVLLISRCSSFLVLLLVATWGIDEAG
jgi:hypothetical protein